MTVFEFVVHGSPVPQPRPRFSSRTRRAYVPRSHPVTSYKESIAAEFLWHFTGIPPLTGPVEVDLVFVFPRQRARTWKTRAMPRYYHDTANADIDNCFKAVADALNGIAYNDDGQIAKISATKWRGEGKEEPHTRILIRELTDGESQHPRDESA